MGRRCLTGRRLLSTFRIAHHTPAHPLPISPSPLPLHQAACCIVSSRSNAHLDAYVLSESSLFVYPTRLVLKTCGTTRLLAAVPGLLAAAASLRLAPCRVKYSRASFLFPSAQPAPHTDFGLEAATLRTHFGHLGGGGAAYVLGDALSGLQWHVFIADESAAAAATVAAAAAAAASARVEGVFSAPPQPVEDVVAAAASQLAAAGLGERRAEADEVEDGRASPTPSAALLSSAPPTPAGGNTAAATVASSTGPPSPGGRPRAATVTGALTTASAPAPLPPLLPPLASCGPTYTLEICMTGLDPGRAAQFARRPDFAGAAAVTAATGVRALLPGADVDDFVFDPCGYSMNGVEGPAFSTIHVTPEPDCSYASVELCGYAAEGLCPSAVVAHVAAIFAPGRMSVAMSVDADVALCPWLLTSLCFPAGYAFHGAAAQDFGGRGRTAFYCLVAEKEEEVQADEAVTAAVAAAAAAAGKPAPGSPLPAAGSGSSAPPSPRGPLRLSPSLFSATSSLAVSCAELGGGGGAPGSAGAPALSGSDTDGPPCEGSPVVALAAAPAVSLPPLPPPARPPSPTSYAAPARAPSPLPPVSLAGAGVPPPYGAPPARAPSPLPPRPPPAMAPLSPSLLSEAGSACPSAALGALLAPLAPAPPRPAGAAARRARPSAPAPLTSVLAAARAVRLASGAAPSIDAALAASIAAHALEDNVYLLDLGAVARAHAAWAARLPRVTPFYAVKCNPDPALVATLAALGAGFDCASAAEVDLVLALGVPPSRIVYANACKRPSDVRHAAAVGVDLTTFDTAAELRKLAALHPASKALLRLRADDPAARCQLGNKYGCEPGDAPRLLALAAQLGISVAGISFHVGSGASNPDAFASAIALARDAFDAGSAAGHAMTILDIGGGFLAPGIAPAAAIAAVGGPGSPGAAAAFPAGLDLGAFPDAVNAALEAHFPTTGGPAAAVRVIAEPGRYFAEAAATLACLVYGVRDGAASCGAPTRAYWITDGLYGSMNSVLYDHATLTARPLVGVGPTGGGMGVKAEVGGVGGSGEEGGAPPVCGEPAILVPPPLPRPPPRTSSDAHNSCGRGCCAHVPPGQVRSTLFGPTCDGLDTVLSDYALPPLAPGDWVAFPCMGAYTLAGASAFNGFDATRPTVVYAWSEHP